MKVLISGYYGFGNIGDELILESILQGVQTATSRSNITVLSADPETTAQEHDVIAVNRWNPVQVLSALAGADVLLSGGGGLFQDATGSLSLYYYLLLIVLARLFRKKVFIYAAGVNELKRLNRSIAARVLNFSTCITVRDQDSCDLLARWGCRKDLLALTADPVLLNTIAVEGNGKKQEKRRIALIVRPPRSGSWPVETFARTADALAERLSAEILLIPFQANNDMSFARRIAAEMRSSARLITEGTAGVIDAIKGADLVISQRLHGVILALLMDIPSVGISDDQKIKRFIRETGQRNVEGIAVMPPDTLVAALMDAWGRREELKTNAKRLMPGLIERAGKTRELFLKRAG